MDKLRSIPFGSDIHFAEFDQYLIRYRLCGEGDQTIVLVPNAPNMIEHYERLVQLLQAKFRLLIFEWPGFGFSIPKKITYDYTLEACTDVAIRLLDHLQIKDSIFALSCISGFVTLEVAARRPDLVREIVCVQTLCWEDQVQWAQKINRRVPLKMPIIGQLVLWFSKEKLAERWYERVIPNPQTRAKFLAIAQSNFKKGAHYSLASAFQALFSQKRPKFKPTDIRSLIIWGSADRSHSKHHQWSMLRYLSNYEPHEFEASGHFPELEQPERFARILLEKYAM